MRDLGILLLWLVSVLCWACSQAPRQDAVKAALADSSGSVQVLDLDSRSNPWRGRYADWDRWIIAHANTSPTAFLPGEKPTNWIEISGRVNKQGVMLPMLEETRLIQESRGREQTDCFKDYPYRVQAAGEIDRELYQRFRDARLSLRASFYPPVPAWLAENPPPFAMLMPNGDVVCKGLPGSQVKASTDSDTACCGGAEHNFRYTSDGELLESAPGFWWDLYFDAKRYAGAEYASLFGEFKNSSDGYIYFVTPGSEEILSVWDWDGTLLPGRALPPARAVEHFTNLDGKQLQRMYRFQQQPVHLTML